MIRFDDEGFRAWKRRYRRDGGLLEVLDALGARPRLWPARRPRPHATSYVRNLFDRRVPLGYAFEMAYELEYRLWLARHLAPGLEQHLESYLHFEWYLQNELSRRYRDHLIHSHRDLFIAERLLDEAPSRPDPDQEVVRVTGAATAPRLTVAARAPTLIDFSCASDADGLPRFARPLRVFARDARGARPAVVRHYDRLLEALARLGPEARRAALRYAMAVAATFHDLGYPLQWYARLSEQIGASVPLLAPMGPEAQARLIPAAVEETAIGGFLRRFLRRTADGDDESGRDAALMPFLRETHGIWGALAIMDVLHRRELEAPPVVQAAMELGALAILRHDLPRMATGWSENGERRLVNDGLVHSLAEDPISFVFFLADELQCWGRHGLRAEPRTDLDTARIVVDREPSYVELEIHARGRLDVRFPGADPDPVRGPAAKWESFVGDAHPPIRYSAV